MPTIIDMHTHTLLGAYDSSLRPDELAQEARRVGLSGVNITEHDRLWDSHALHRFRGEQDDLLINNGIEVTTDQGHVIAVGLPVYSPGIGRLAELRRAADEVGAYLILAHPFRHYLEPAQRMRKGSALLDPSPEVLARLPVFEYVDAIEALNGLNTPAENVLALQVARRLGKPVTGGSDCHSNHGIGYYCTVFDVSIETPEQLLTALHAGHFHAGHDLAAGSPVLFTEASLSGG